MVNESLRKHAYKEREQYLEKYQNSDLTVSQFANKKIILASTHK